MLCPVCNGLQSIQLPCPKCGSALQDDGKLSDAFGPYAPYVPHDEEEEYAYSFLDAQPEDSCPHIASCPSCDCQVRVQVAELG